MATSMRCAKGLAAFNYCYHDLRSHFPEFGINARLINVTMCEKLYNENEVFLEPLLCCYRGNEFAVQYRQIMKSKLRKDIGWRQYPDKSGEYLIIDSILSGMSETFISCLQTRAFSLDSAYRFASQSVNNGIAPAIKREFGISILPPEN